MLLVQGPMQEVIETVELKVSKNMQVDVCGNISVINGFVDFYVISPSGNTILCYNEVLFCWFNFSAIENGTYTMHLMNIQSEDDIVVTLIYGLNFKVSVQEILKWHTVTTWQITATTSPYFNILRAIWEILKIIFYALIPTLVEQLPKFFRWLRWMKKYRKPKTLWSLND